MKLRRECQFKDRDLGNNSINSRFRVMRLNESLYMVLTMSIMCQSFC